MLLISHILSFFCFSKVFIIAIMFTNSVFKFINFFFCTYFYIKKTSGHFYYVFQSSLSTSAPSATFLSFFFFSSRASAYLRHFCRKSYCKCFCDIFTVKSSERSASAQKKKCGSLALKLD